MLSNDAIHLWRISLTQPWTVLWGLKELLSPDEQVRAGGYRFEKDRQRYILARGALRTILAGYLDMHPHDVRFQYGPWGKPCLATSIQQAPLLYFNLSYSRHYALCAVSRCSEIGVDVEHIDQLPDLNRLGNWLFSPSERVIWDQLPAQHRLRAFYQCWVQKEAYVKAVGCGLTQSLSELAVSIVPGEPAGFQDPDRARVWSMHFCETEQDTIAAIALEAHHWCLTCWEWPDVKTSATDVQVSH